MIDPSDCRRRVDVSVVIPAFNREATIARAVLSATVLQQVSPVRVIVIDDGSTDATSERARRSGAEVIRQTNRGVAAARNIGLQAANTQWVAFLDSDDEWLPDHLRRLTEAVSTNVLVASNARAVPSGRLIGHPHRTPHPVTSFSVWWPGNPVVTSAALVNREAAVSVGGFNRLRLCEDLDLWTRLLQIGPGLLLPSVTCIYHEHPNQISSDEAMMRRARLDLLWSYGIQPWLDPKLLSLVPAASAWDEWRFRLRKREYLQSARALRHGFFGRSTVRALRDIRKYRNQIGRL